MKLDVLPKTPWYADGLKFECTQCGNCCTGGPGYVWITRKEIRAVAEYLKMSVEEVLEKYCRWIGKRISLKERRNLQGQYDCIFLTAAPPEEKDGVTQERRVCAVYPVRPKQCTTWPFWKEALASESAWNHAETRCPGINQGRRYEREEIEEIRKGNGVV
jgi:uncharacterized protein